MGGDIFRYTLNISVANICRLLVLMVFQKIMIRPRIIDASTSHVRDYVTARVILLFIIRPWNIQITGQ